MKFYIYTRDHQPPHVHVKSQEGEARFCITDKVEFMDSKGMKSKDIKLTESILEDNRENILNEWIKIHGE